MRPENNSYMYFGLYETTPDRHVIVFSDDKKHWYDEDGIEVEVQLHKTIVLLMQTVLDALNN